MGIPLLGGKNKNLKCKCGKLRYPRHDTCTECYEKENPSKGFRNKQGHLVNARLPKDVWQAVNFAAKLIRDGKCRVDAIRISSNYYGVEYKDVQSGLSQRWGMSRKGKKKSCN